MTARTPRFVSAAAAELVGVTERHAGQYERRTVLQPLRENGIKVFDTLLHHHHCCSRSEQRRAAPTTIAVFTLAHAIIFNAPSMRVKVEPPAAAPFATATTVTDLVKRRGRGLNGMGGDGSGDNGRGGNDAPPGEQGAQFSQRPAPPVFAPRIHPHPGRRPPPADFCSGNSAARSRRGPGRAVRPWFHRGAVIIVPRNRRPGLRES